MASLVLDEEEEVGRWCSVVGRGAGQGRVQGSEGTQQYQAHDDVTMPNIILL